MNVELLRKGFFFFVDGVLKDDVTFTDEEVLEIRDFLRKAADEFDIEVHDGESGE